MSDIFDRIEQTAKSPFALLASELRAAKNYPLLFEARVMEQRHKMGLPPLRVDGIDDVPSDRRADYDEALSRAAREVGSLFLADGDILRAWPYFRAIGDRGPVADAIEKLETAEDGVIQIALEERANPRKGFEMLLARFGTCRAITYFEQYPDRDTREECIVLLVRTLHRELVESLRRTIVKQEGAALAGQSVPELIAGRDWLFGELDYYVDTSHLVAVIRFALDLADVQALRLAIELCEYGKHLSTQFKYKADPPFDDVYVDHAAYLSALAGENVDACIEHFLAKVHACDPAETGSAPAQVLVALLTRLKRYPEAIQVSLDHLSQAAGEQLLCPSVPQLCQMAGDYKRLKQIARECGDLLSFAAATLHPPTT